MKEKSCNVCGEINPLTDEFWHRDKDKKDGYRTICKECCKAWQAKYRKENSEKIKARKAKYCDTLPDSYVRHLLRSYGYTKTQITPELIEERRNQLIAKHLNVPVGTDMTNLPDSVPDWAMGVKP